jgi:rhodanese-related sulfurtransferase
MPEETARSFMGESVTENDKGKLIGPVHSEYGYHILTITDVERVEMESTQDPANVMSPEELHQRLDTSGSGNMRILDIREEWEWNIAKIEGSQLVTRENCESILSAIDKKEELVLIDWKQERSPSFQNWLLQRGFSCVKCLEGGIDTWADKVDPSLPRYEIDEDDGYRYEDILEENDHDH